MKALLTAINAKYIHSNLAVYDLRAYCRQYKEHIELAEYTINHDAEYILADIFERKPEVIALSCYIWNIAIIEALIGDLHKVLPDADIWLGGPEASYRAEELLSKHESITGVMVGEGEETFLQLMEYYVDGAGEPSSINGIVFREGDRLCRTELRKPIPLSSIPFPYEDLTEFENRIIYYESSRGCPFSCSYCLSSVEKKLRFRDIGMVRQELQFFLDRKVRQVKFVDRTFNAWHEHAAAIWQYIHEHDNGITNFHFEIAADLLREEDIRLLSQLRPGLIQLEIGVQSTNAETIKEIHRTMKLEELKEAVRRIREKQNIHIHLDLIAGLPREGYDSFCHSFNEVYRLEPDQLQLGFLKVLPGTDMQREAGEYGLVYRSAPPYEVLYTDWISFASIRKLKRVEEMLEMYYNSAQFTASMRLLLSFFETPFEMYEALSEYYGQRVGQERKLSRTERYELLLEFAKQYVGGREEQFQECLTYDLYLRENMKNRPSFAPSADSYREQIKEFYRREAAKRQYLPEYEGFDGKQLARMTHMEHFNRHPVTGEERETFLLFDYRRRNPLTFEAAVIELEGQVTE